VEGSWISGPEAAMNAVSFHQAFLLVSSSSFVFSSPKHRPPSCTFSSFSGRVAFLLLVFSFKQSNVIASERALLNIWLQSTFGSTASIFRRPSNNASILQPPLAQTSSSQSRGLIQLSGDHQQLRQPYGSAWAFSQGGHN
jgi:hypothetical protein